MKKHLQPHLNPVNPIEEAYSYVVDKMMDKAFKGNVGAFVSLTNQLEQIPSSKPNAMLYEANKFLFSILTEGQRLKYQEFCDDLVEKKISNP